DLSSNAGVFCYLGVAKSPHSPASLGASLYSFSCPSALSLLSVIPQLIITNLKFSPLCFVVITALFGKDRLRYPYSA
ncbi:hypothetical protein ACQ676_004642, partial [Vibrio fluvialis]